MSRVPFNGDARELSDDAFDEFLSDLGTSAQSRVYVERKGIKYITLRSVGYWEPLETHEAWIEVPLNPLCREAIAERCAARAKLLAHEQPMIDEDPCIKTMRDNY